MDACLFAVKFLNTYVALVVVAAILCLFAMGATGAETMPDRIFAAFLWFSLFALMPAYYAATRT